MSQKKYVSLARLSDFLANIKAKYSQIGHKHTTADITDYVVDTQFSSTSNNPIANKTVDAEFEAISQAMNALDSSIDDKADAGHGHEISDIANLQTVLDGKASSTHSHTMPTYDLATSKSSTNGNVKLNLTAGGSASGTDSITIVGSGATTVTTDASGIVTIKGTNTTYSAITNEEIDEICANTYTSMLNAIAAEGVSF